MALAGRRILHFALLMLGSLLANLLPLPWKVASLAFVVAAIVFAIRALVAVRRSRLRGSLTPMLVVGLVVAGMVALSSISTLVTWPLQMRHQECLADALTISAQDACESQYREDVIDWQKQLQGMTDGQR